MAGAREIRGQIRSVKNTKKVTRALEMVSASKIRKATAQMERTRPYADQMREVAGHMARANPEYVHPFMREREDIGTVSYVIVSTDRGLCGGLNANLFRELLGAFSDWQQKGAQIETVTIGSKGNAFFKRLGTPILAHAQHLGEEVQLAEVIGPLKILLDRFREGDVDRVFVAYNRFINTMTQRPTMMQLLPLPPSDEELSSHSWDYIYEPDAVTVLDDVLVRYVEVLAYQAVMENVASEQAARMVAMKSASDNADSLIDELQLVYNKARQASITQEISEIVSGAAAISG